MQVRHTSTGRVMLLRAQIEQAKTAADKNFFRSILQPSQDERTLLHVLEMLGRLPEGFDGSLFIPLLTHASDNVRLAAIKNLGKVKDESLLEHAVQMARREQNTLVRREAISTIGRMRTKRALSFLIESLQDQDPKVVLQAIRALLYFKEEPSVKEALLRLVSHPNELIRSAIQQGFTVPRKGPGTARGHAPSPDCLKNVLVLADVRDAIKLVPDESVHLTFTSPPYYNARDYTIYKSYEEYLGFLVSIFAEVHRITKEGRFFVLNTSPVIVPRMSRQHSSTRYLIPFDIHPRLISIGFDFVEDIVWVKPDPSAKNRNGGFFQHRKPLGYKANSVSEYVIVYRKRTEKLIDWNMRQYDEETIEASKVKGEYEKTNVWKIAPSTSSVHPAIFPKELAARVVQFYSYKGDLIFDPFAGSGTVGEVALSLERFFFLVEQEQKYVDYARRRLSTGTLFSPTPPRFYTFDQFRATMQSDGKKQ